ncbi:MarR family winged helix-turn-helix transcriptional regulator [Streptococcus equinus]|uniref:MarR family winged helix-turn-helix transcriptional regulator n=1 Tax=Streptococcus equinus TaxID=1335 RepID=UPI00190E97A3|nr:MarR family transcriptional regulator [Streptococcus equinus]
MRVNDVYTDIYEKFSTLQWLMKRHRILSQSQFGQFADTSRGQGRILAMLKIQPEIATKELAYLLGIRQQSLNESLKKMEKSGYVYRKQSEKDRRVMIVHLTEKGEKVELPKNDYHEVLDCLGPEELEQLSEFLSRIIEAFQSQNPSHLDDKKIEERMNMARERMGDEQFERLLEMRERGLGHSKLFDSIPGPERFSKNYDGPVPDRSKFDFFDS